MIGIYRIYNCLNGKSYIGQSWDIEKRFSQHLYHRNSKTASYIDSDIGKYGIENFAFFILEICDPEDLDWKEDFYIKLFQSDMNGYNLIAGGQDNNGESNSNSKLTSIDVYNIREMYNQRLNPEVIYKKYYFRRISIGNFYNIWEGRTWPQIHMDVYTEENKLFHKTHSKPSQNKIIILSDEEVMFYRTEFVNKSAEQIYNEAKVPIKFNTFKSMLNGGSYKHLPFYIKKKKIWKWPDKV